VGKRAASQAMIAGDVRQYDEADRSSKPKVDGCIAGGIALIIISRIVFAQFLQELEEYVSRECAKLDMGKVVSPGHDAKLQVYREAFQYFIQVRPDMLIDALRSTTDVRCPILRSQGFQVYQPFLSQVKLQYEAALDRLQRRVSDWHTVLAVSIVC